MCLLCLTFDYDMLQGMAYLHSKDIIHKNLTSKNIFLELEKVVITDFGLQSISLAPSKSR